MRLAVPCIGVGRGVSDVVAAAYSRQLEREGSQVREDVLLVRLWLDQVQMGSEGSAVEV